MLPNMRNKAPQNEWFNDLPSCNSQVQKFKIRMHSVRDSNEDPLTAGTCHLPTLSLCFLSSSLLHAKGWVELGKFLRPLIRASSLESHLTLTAPSKSLCPYVVKVWGKNSICKKEWASTANRTIISWGLFSDNASLCYTMENFEQCRNVLSEEYTFRNEFPLLKIHLVCFYLIMSRRIFESSPNDLEMCC